jgi:hypothetical protein
VAKILFAKRLYDGTSGNCAKFVKRRGRRRVRGDGEAMRRRWWILFGIVSILSILGAMTAGWLLRPNPYYQPVDLQMLGAIDLNQGDARIGDIPSRIRRLDGQKVETAGEIWAPTVDASGQMTKFLLSYGRYRHTYGPQGPPLGQHVVDCVPAGNAQSLSYIDRAVVRGTLHVRLRWSDDGWEPKRLMSAYSIDVDSITPVPATVASPSVSEMLPRFIITTPLFLVAAWYAWHYIARYRSRRRVELFVLHRCITCGYDLRGGHERCPECGARVPTSILEVESNR